MQTNVKPRIRPEGPFAHHVTFPCGGTARIMQIANVGFGEKVGFSVHVVDGENETRVLVPGYGGRGYADSFEKAFTHAWAAAARVNETPAWGTAEQVHELARQCDNDRTLFTKTIKRIAAKRFGVKLSAKGSRGTGYGWVHVRVSEQATGRDLAVLKLVSGHGHASTSASVRPCGGERVAVICRLAGHPLPEGFRVTAPDWD